MTCPAVGSRRSILKTSPRLLLAVCLPLLLGCPGRLPPELLRPDGGATGAGGGTGIASCPDAPRLLDTHCFACHGSPPIATFGTLDLEADGVAGRVVGQAAYAEAGGLCGGMGNLLEPGTLPATGILIDKLRFTQDCGMGMPFGAVAPLAAAELECLQTWANGLVMMAGGD